jgi:hypothetical protein
MLSFSSLHKIIYFVSTVEKNRCYAILSTCHFVKTIFFLTEREVHYKMEASLGINKKGIFKLWMKRQVDKIT